ncbi:uncharacterized protein [Linepithema humile]|uniref:uncharacterized protein n=1 Tax=Linepithema humile TaxID=83485 RepID=UPI00351EAE63
MSRDIKIRCTDCQEHAEASVIPFASSFSINSKQDEPNDRRGSFRPVTSSVASTCASETDEGDYETSSEGMVLTKRSSIEIHGSQVKESFYGYFKEKSTSLSKLAALDSNVSPIKEEVIPDLPRELMENRLTQKTRNICGSLISTHESLAKLKSQPILKCEVSNSVSSNFEAMKVALMSDSSFAREKKMSIIMSERMALISSYSVMTRSISDFLDQQYETRRLESKMMLPILRDTTIAPMINDKRSEELVAEVMFHETKNNHRTMNWDSCQDATTTFVNDESAVNLTNDDDLVDVATNPYSSIKSMYFPPNPSDSLFPPLDDKLKMTQRVFTDVEALRKIDYELRPLCYRYSEVIGKTRALGLSISRYDFDISYHLNQPDAFDRSVLSPTNHFLNQMCPPRIATSCSIADRSGLVDKTTSPSSTFSVVGKPTPRGSCTSCLSENGLNCRQEALSFAIRDPIRALKDFNGLRSSIRVGNSASYFPATDIHASQEENVPGECSRNEYVLDNDFQRQRKSNAAIKGGISFRIPEREICSRSIGRVSIGSPSNTLCATEYNSHHRHFNQTIENFRPSDNNFFEVQKKKSSIFRESCFDGLHRWNTSHSNCASKSTVVEIIDDNWRSINDETNKKSSKYSEIPSDDLNSIAVQTKFITCGNNCESTESERVKNDRICSQLELKSIDRGVGPDRQISRTIFPSASQIRVVNVNTKFHATVEKRYTNRAVSPIPSSQMTTVSCPKNILLAARMSSVFVQQVCATSSTEMLKVESPSEIRSIDIDKKDTANATGKRDFCAQKVDSRLSESDVDEADLATAKRRKTRYFCPPEAKEKIAIVKPKSSKTTDVNFTTPKYVDKMVPKMSCQVVPFAMRRSQRMPLSSNRDNELFYKYADFSCLTEETNEKRWKRASRTSVSRSNRSSSQEDCILSTSVARNSRHLLRVGTKMREYREFARQRVARAIPGMRSSPEDFFCDT